MTIEENLNQQIEDLEFIINLCRSMLDDSELTEDRYGNIFQDLLDAQKERDVLRDTFGL